MNKDIPTKFVFVDKGDRSVGINGVSVYVEYQGSFYNPEGKDEFVNAVKDGLSEIMDVDYVIEEHSHTCRYCRQEFTHVDDYCDSVCTSKKCVEHEAKEEAIMYAEMEQIAEERASNDVPSGDYDADMDYFRNRNERILRSINGAGVKA